MAERVCPWWIGCLMASPIRKLVENPEKLLRPYMRSGITVLEPGPGMGFFTLPMAAMVGPEGRVVAVDIQTKMLDGLRRRARRSGLMPRIETRLALPGSMGIADLAGKVDFVLAYAMVHEMPSAESFFREAAVALKPGGLMLLAEPAGHVKPERFEQELSAAHAAGLAVAERPQISRALAAVLKKP